MAIIEFYMCIYMYTDINDNNKYKMRVKRREREDRERPSWLAVTVIDISQAEHRNEAAGRQKWDSKYNSSQAALTRHRSGLTDKMDYTSRPLIGQPGGRQAATWPLIWLIRKYKQLVILSVLFPSDNWCLENRKCLLHRRLCEALGEVLLGLENIMAGLDPVIGNLT